MKVYLKLAWTLNESVPKVGMESELYLKLGWNLNEIVPKVSMDSE